MTNYQSPIENLLKIMADLRNQKTGCPWDIEQTFETIAPYTIEEAYEVADAIQRQDQDALKDELGDLLFQVVFYAQMSKEDGNFDFDDIVESISEKMIRRHPHVFGDKNDIQTSQRQSIAWEDQKAIERSGKSTTSGVLDDVAMALPALLRAQKLQKRAARVGFDWKELDPVMEKIEEELKEVEEALNTPKNAEHIKEEIGDLLFACVNLARHAGIDAEQALIAGNTKFERRFKEMEGILRKTDQPINKCSLTELEELWETVKKGEQNS